LRMGIDPTRVFNNINHFLCQHDEVGRHATMFFGIADSEGQLEYLNAGHPSPILVRDGETSELYTEGSLPLGLIPEAQYRPARAQLQPGDTLALFSDGVTEANDRENRLYGFDRLYDVLRGSANADLSTLKQHIFESVDRFAHGAEQADDITVLLVRYLAGSVSTDTIPPQMAPEGGSATPGPR
jgi:sigma-B regulation protein RsbU (phosphoserine phosphatase)